MLLILGVLVYLFNDRLTKKYNLLAKRWKMPVATYKQATVGNNPINIQRSSSTEMVISPKKPERKSLSSKNEKHEKHVTVL